MYAEKNYKKLIGSTIFDFWDPRAYRIHKYILVRFLAKEVKYWSDFGQIFKQNWSDSQSDFGEY